MKVSKFEGDSETFYNVLRSFKFRLNPPVVIYLTKRSGKDYKCNRIFFLSFLKFKYIFNTTLNTVIMIRLKFGCINDGHFLYCTTRQSPKRLTFQHRKTFNGVINTLSLESVFSYIFFK